MRPRAISDFVFPILALLIHKNVYLAELALMIVVPRALQKVDAKAPNIAPDFRNLKVSLPKKELQQLQRASVLSLRTSMAVHLVPQALETTYGVRNNLNFENLFNFQAAI